MTILDTYTDATFTNVLLIVAILGMVFFGLLCIGAFAEAEVLGGVACLALAIFAGFVANGIHDEGPNTYHKVIIEDFNDVYKQGFVIVDRDGEIYTIRDDNEYDE